MKRLFLLVFCLATVGIASAQPNCPQPFGKKKNKSSVENRFQIGAGVGLTYLKGDKDMAGAYGLGSYFNFDYQLYRSIYAGFRFQYGSLKIGEDNKDKRNLDSRYYGIGAGVYMHPFELMFNKEGNFDEVSIGKDLLESFYLGVDFLSVSNKIKLVYRTSPVDNDTYGPLDGIDIDGNPIFKEKVSALILPSWNIGFAPALIRNKKDNDYSKNTLRIVVNAQFNYANNDDLDGYVPINTVNQAGNGNKNNDFYSFYSLGFRYSF